MAASAPDVSSVLALRVKAEDLLLKGHDERYATYLERMLAAARALGVQNCLITARVQLHMVASRLTSASKCGDLSDQHALRKDAAELVLSAGAALQARRAAGTLLPSACHPHEAAYEERYMLHCAHVRREHPSVLAVISKHKVGRFFGYATFLYGGTHAAALQMLCSTGAISLTTAQRDELWALLTDGLDMMAASSTTGLITTQTAEANLDDNAGHLLRDGFVPTAGVGARVRDAWCRLGRSGVLAPHKIGEAVEHSRSTALERELAVQAAAAAPGLRTCALPGCGARERHPSHFKTCGACKTVAYCSKEHQTTDWQRHKADCKAARKAAASGGAA